MAALAILLILLLGGILWLRDSNADEADLPLGTVADIDRARLLETKGLMAGPLKPAQGKPAPQKVALSVVKPVPPPAVPKETKPNPEILLAQKEAARLKAANEAKDKQNRYLQALHLARKALEQEDFDRALQLFQEAGKINQTGEISDGLRLAKSGSDLKKAQDEAKRKQAVERQRAADFNSLLAQAKTSLENKQFDKAIMALSQANKLFPNDATVLAGLDRARQGQKALLLAQQKAEDERKRQLQAQRAAEEAARKKNAYRASLSEARQALTKGNVEAAVNAFTKAEQLFPSDREARAGLQEAIQARDRMKAKAERQAKERERLLAAQKAREREEARLKAAAKAKLQEEERKKAEADARLKAEIDKQAARRKAEIALKKQEEQKRLDALVAKHLARGRSFLKDKKFKEAEAAFADAKKVVPDHPSLARAFQELQQARRDAELAAQNAANKNAFKIAPLEKKTKSNPKFDRHMTAGNQHRQAGRFSEAIREFEAALRLMPGNAVAQAALKKAREKDRK